MPSAIRRLVSPSPNHDLMLLLNAYECVVSAPNQVTPQSVSVVHRMTANDPTCTITPFSEGLKCSKYRMNRVRQEMISRIESLILKRMNTKKANMMARRLECELYRRADSFDAYQDTKTLKRRVKILALEIGNRKSNQS
uniref:Uncharacterized protein n=1 Tax=Leptocylindrus danicus TaxID=163516 RepID=A0A7S2KE14_9STRA